MDIKHMLTPEGEHLPAVPHSEYPRPRLKRRDWLCLNGEWEFETTADFALPREYTSGILVPFCPESLLSGINRCFPEGTVLCYRRAFNLPQGFRGKRILLHFGAVDQICEIYINGQQVCRHSGGYLHFSTDITGFVGEENRLEVLVRDELDHTLPWGKQRRDRQGMWYTPVSGIWQSVWLEPVPEEYISDIDVSTGTDSAELKIHGPQSGIAEFEGRRIPFDGGILRLEPEKPEQWSPENPKLYEFTIHAGEDCVSSYFALRTLSVKTVKGIKRLCLNGKPYFFNGLLDQGYWSDGIYTPASLSCYEKDILAMKSLGFNTLRKHIKIEPDRFYYDCDRLGMIVFQDMVNNGGYSFIRDTALPTAGLLSLPDRYLNRSRESRKAFLEHMEGTVKQLKNHPCICYWTIFNEGWGQFSADEAYIKLKALDSSRFIDSASGWFRQKLSDVESLHIYFKKLKLGRQDRPQVLSEFGGYSLKLPEHSANLENTYGYRKYTDRGEFVHALRELYSLLPPLAEKGLCAAIYTQVSDVEDETNGLLTYDRRVLKIKPEELCDIAGMLCRTIRDTGGQNRK